MGTSTSREMATPQSTAAVDEHPADWAVWLLLSLLVAAILAEFFGWWGALAALPLSACAAVVVHLAHVRTPLWRLSEIGPIDVVLAGCGYSGTISPRWIRRAYLQIAGGVLLVGFCVYAYAALDETEPGTRVAAIWQIGRHFVELLGYVALKWVGFKNSTWRLLIAGEGLFRLTDPTRPWVMKSDARHADLRLGPDRAVSHQRSRQRVDAALKRAVPEYAVRPAHFVRPAVAVGERAGAVGGGAASAYSGGARAGDGLARTAQQA
jgi:hypothetical protein